MMYENMVLELRKASDEWRAKHPSTPTFETRYDLALLDAANTIEELAKDLDGQKDYEAFWQKEAEEALRRFQVAVNNKHCGISAPYMSGFVTHWIPHPEPPAEEPEVERQETIEDITGGGRGDE